MPRTDRDALNALNQISDTDQLRPPAGSLLAESKAAELTAALQGSPFLMRVMDQAVRLRISESRSEKERNAKKAAAEMFWDTMMNRLARAQYMNIFLESGSSLVHVSEALESRLNRQQGWKIATNNMLVLLRMLPFTEVEIRCNPPVFLDPKDPYGAIVTLKCKQAYEEPPVQSRALSQKEKDAINEIIELLKPGADKQIILATASGWDTAHRVTAFRGPYVSSHVNMLFKRSFFMTGAPVVLFLSRHKVDPKFPEAAFKCRTDKEKPDVGMRYCYPVFGEELPLANALVDVPLALCIGYEREMDESEADIRQVGEMLTSLLQPELEKAKFDLEYAAKEFIREDRIQAGAIMVANERFLQLFPP